VISCRAHAETLTRHGYPITSDQVSDRFPRPLDAVMATLEVEAELGRSLPDDFHTQVYAEVFRLFAASLEATPHIDEALAAIELPVCVASSGPPDNKSAPVLNRVGLYGRFAPHIFSAVQVHNGKPAPDLFLFAAEQIAGGTGAMPRDRRQHPRYHWRACRRNDRASAFMAAAIAGRLRRHAARRRGRHCI